MSEIYTRKRTFVILRYVLVVAGAYLFLWSEEAGSANSLLGLLIALALASNVILAALPEKRVFSVPGFLALVVVDITWISAGLAVTSRVGSDLLVLYLLVLLCAAAAESLLLVTATAALAGAAYLAVLATGGPAQAVLTTPNLMRLPFLFATALACGYLLEELKRERRRGQRIAELEKLRAQALSAAMRDLESPLQTMASALDELERNRLVASPRGVKRVIGEILVNLGHMSLMVNNYLDFAKLSGGHLPDGSGAEPVDLAEVLEEVRIRFAPFARSRKVKLASPNGRLPLIEADSRAVEHVFANLVHNAIKFSPAGGSVEITASATGDWAEIGVVNTGPEIEPGRIDALFSPKLAGEAEGEAGRLSLGLHLAHHLTRLSKGCINVESLAGYGTKFSVRLPIWRDPRRRECKGAPGEATSVTG